MQVLSASALAEILAGWPTDQPAFVDFEHNGRPVWDPGAAIAGVSLAIAGVEEPLVIPLKMQGQVAEPGIREPLYRFLSSHPAGLGAFWLQHEAAWSSVHFAATARWAHDPYIAAALCGAGRDNERLALKALTKRFLHRDVIEFDTLGPVDFTLLDAQDPRVLRYMGDDALNTRDLHAFFYPKLGGLMAAYADEVAVEVLLGIDWALGTEIDQAGIAMAKLAAEQGIRDAEQAVYADLGGPFSIASVAQLGRRLTERGVTSPLLTPGGHPSWSQEALQLIAAQSPEAQRVLTWRTWMTRQRNLQRFDGLSGQLQPDWFTIGKDGHSRMTGVLTNLSQDVRQYFPARSGTRWVHVSWPAAAEVWWMLGWLHPQFVIDGLLRWDESAAGLGVTGDQLSKLAVFWALSGGDVAYMQRKGALDGIGAREAEAAQLALSHTWAPLLEHLQSLLAQDVVAVRGIHERMVPMPSLSDMDMRRKQFLATVCQLHQWSASKHLMLYLAANGIGEKFIPVADTLAFQSAQPLESLADLIDQYAFRFRPTVLPMFVQGGATWGEAADRG